LRLAARLLCGSRGRNLERALGDAEHDDTKLSDALREIDAFDALDRRRLLSAWSWSLRPTPEREKPAA